MSEPSRSDGALRATSGAVRIERFVYGGLGLGHVTDASAPQGAVLVPFVLPGELITVEHSQDRREALLDQVIEASAERVEPGCPHFGVCGGCHLQMSGYPEQLRLKQYVLLDALRRAAVTNAPEPQVHAGEPWGYRNRIRLRLEAVDGQLRFGYTRHGAGQVFLPITTCPIAAPVLWQAAERMLARAVEEPALRQWLGAAREVEFFTTGDQKRLQILLLCPDSPKLLAKGLATSFQRGVSDLASRLAHVVELAGAGAVQAFWSPLRLGRKLAEWGTPGLAYGVSTGFESAVSSAPQEERYWVERGGFFQVNRYLLPTLVELVCAGHGGSLAWDLFAGVGLFARVLARRFEQVVAVEAHPGAASELARALRRLGPAHKAEQRTSISFLERAVLERDRPELIVLDPPRAGAGLAVCELLLRLRAPELVYVSCDPVTLGRDLAVLQRGYDLKALHLVDLFPQTYHQEAVVLLQRRA